MENITVFSLNWIKMSVAKSDVINIEPFLYDKKKYYIISEVIHWHRASFREATASALNKGQIKGTNKKPFAQKGRGMARQGSLKNPHQKGGGVAFPPQNRIYKYKMNRKKRHLALKMLFFFRLNEKKIHVFKNLFINTPSTKIVNQFLSKFFRCKSLVIDNHNSYLMLSIKNIKNIKFLSFRGLNTFDFLKYPNIIVTKNIINKIVYQFKLKG